MKREMENLNLQDAFKPTPEKCRNALMTAARSVKEEEPVKRVTIRTVLIAACIILATTAIAIAATNSFGWNDFFKILYGETNAVPEEAQKIMDSTEEQAFVLGPVTFTVQSLFADEHKSMVTTRITATDGKLALFSADVSEDDCLNSNGENGEALAGKLGIDPNLTWTAAAKQLNCPLYRVYAELTFDEKYRFTDGMSDTLYDDEGQLVYFNMWETSLHMKGTLPAVIRLHYWEIDPETGKETSEQRSEAALTIPVSVITETADYPFRDKGAGFGLRLDGVSAKRNASGVYMYVDFTAQDGMTEDDFMEYQVFPVWLHENGEAYPEGMSMSWGFETDQWPHISATSLITVDHIPDRIWMQLVDDNAGPEDEPAPKIELKRIKP
jgi:hypothetical protein